MYIVYFLIVYRVCVSEWDNEEHFNGSPPRPQPRGPRTPPGPPPPDDDEEDALPVPGMYKRILPKNFYFRPLISYSATFELNRTTFKATRTTRCRISQPPCQSVWGFAIAEMKAKSSNPTISEQVASCLQQIFCRLGCQDALYDIITTHRSIAIIKTNDMLSLLGV